MCPAGGADGGQGSLSLENKPQSAPPGPPAPWRPVLDVTWGADFRGARDPQKQCNRTEQEEAPFLHRDPSRKKVKKGGERGQTLHSVSKDSNF